jgi:hypothetical protein
LENDTRRCKANTRAGKPCGAAATAGGLCFFHANPNKASELGRIGGKKRRSINAEISVPPPPLDTVKALRDLVPQLIRDVQIGKLNPRVAAGLAPLLNLQFRVIEQAGLEELAQLQQRVSAIEKRVSLKEGGIEPWSGRPVEQRASKPGTWRVENEGSGGIK